MEAISMSNGGINIPDYASDVLDEIKLRNIEVLFNRLYNAREGLCGSPAEALKELREAGFLTRYNTINLMPWMSCADRIKVLEFNRTVLLDPEYLKLPDVFA